MESILSWFCWQGSVCWDTPSTFSQKVDISTLAFISCLCKLSPVSFRYVSPFSSSEKYILCRPTRDESLGHLQLFPEHAVTHVTSLIPRNMSELTRFPKDIKIFLFFFKAFWWNFCLPQVIYCLRQLWCWTTASLCFLSDLRKWLYALGKLFDTRQICKKGLPVNYQSSQIITILIIYL